MKARLLLLFVLLIQVLYSQNEDWEKFSKKNKSILGLNAIVADKNYYSQAILEFLIVKQIIAKTGKDTFDIPKTSPIYRRMYNQAKGPAKEKIFLDNGKHIIKLFDFGAGNNLSLRNGILDIIGVAPCEIVVPEKVDDLTSGFQFRTYLFRGDNRTALQAFGIINNELKTSDLYNVIDYLQYYDCNCTGLPKIRYAVGIRSEFRISVIELNKDNEENSLSLEKLAAKVEFGKIKVDLSMKTIGITGTKARLNIPVNASFDVKTYSEYKTVIEFIRNSIGDPTTVHAQPQLIPVMDEYRTSISDINTAVFDELKIIQKKYEKQVSKVSDSITDPEIANIQKIINESLKEEITLKNAKRKTLYDIDKRVNDLSRYLNILNYTYSPNNFKEEVNSKLKEDNDIIATVEVIYAQGFDALNKKDLKEALNCFTEVYQQRPTYGNADELKNLIKKTDDKDPDSIKKMYDTILKKYMWLAPTGTRDKLVKTKESLK